MKLFKKALNELKLIAKAIHSIK